jgi:hypothetical protein
MTNSEGDTAWMTNAVSDERSGLGLGVGMQASLLSSVVTSLTDTPARHRLDTIDNTNKEHTLPT